MRTTADHRDMDAQVDQTIEQRKVGGQGLCILRVTNNRRKCAVEIGGQQELSGKHVAKSRQSWPKIAATRRERAPRYTVDADQRWVQTVFVTETISGATTWQFGRHRRQVSTAEHHRGLAQPTLPVQSWVQTVFVADSIGQA